ncbi:MRP-family nucleotide-binding protein [Gottschalkia acidurici 9a]|uniref:Iron-sulfur cluster carrier protein n=1 Tax=Gottschalkia acidurici (strain ATCC 7906 / DSM 604 / BCRC 14475 / CIP 104303 / KCTC 5404 / NCIMB 10678 / 9a) TaxID=1128398 RepID=K0AXI8_GOTA9|nr:Mrp/NBP35 family ATP-binding protein [Gottschalkia acidurici]AFS77492.1 MRP-family nucleotide-binding protein [Gottschalkia acidurici 9a]
MSECQTCPSSSSCSEQDKENCGSMIVNNPHSKIGKIIGVMSGKGGVGKSTVSVLLAKELKKQGYKVGVLDADITGPSIPRLLDISEERAYGKEDGTLIPVETKEGIKVMSLNLLIKEESDPVIWRGPMIGEIVKQFYKDVIWEELDYLVIDMPPGTGDVALTAMQSIPIDGIVMVSIPQDLVSMIVAKAVNMTKTMKIDVIGLIQNMSYIICPDCDKKIRMFENEDIDAFLKDMNLKLLGELPMTREVNNINKEKLSADVDATIKDITKQIVSSLS